MTAVLLDANVLIALAVEEHVHHQAAERWFATLNGGFATCPITQGALLRLVIREGATCEQALEVLASVTGHQAHELWPDDLDFSAVRMEGVIGHRQVTDAYLAALARLHGGALATFDGGVAALHSDVSVAITSSD